MKTEDVFTIKDAARFLGISQSRVRVLRESRHVGYYDAFARRWALTAADVDAMRERHTGRPKRIIIEKGTSE